MRVIIRSDYDKLSDEASLKVENVIKKHASCVLGLGTGFTTLGLYGKLIDLHKKRTLSFRDVTTFNLAEYHGLDPSHPQCYRYSMEINLFKEIDINPENTHFPEAVQQIDVIDEKCRLYEESIKSSGGIDLIVIGIGRDGHIAFNEPGSSFSSRTRLVALDEQTISDNARFFQDGGKVPEFAVTIGIATILEAKEILIMASGKNKAEIVARAIEGPLTSMVTASALQMHPKVTAIIDEDAACALQRYNYYKHAETAEKKINMSLF